MALLAKIIEVLAAAVPALLDWWSKRQADQAQAEAEARRAAVRDDPVSAWLRKFNSQAGPNPADPPGTDQSRRDA